MKTHYGCRFFDSIEKNCIEHDTDIFNDNAKACALWEARQGFCPVCGEPSLKKVRTCSMCHDCGWSSCG
jgi:hypothetical protein